MQLAQLFMPAAAPAAAAPTDAVADEFSASALKLSALRQNTIVRLTHDQPLLRRAAIALRREARGLKLSRRLRRKAELGMAGAF